MLNTVILIGRLTRDPELKYTASGIAVTHFTLAIDRPFATQDGKKETDFIDVVCWRQLAERVAQYLTKGRLAAAQGRLQIRSYQTPEGQKRKVAEVVADDVRFLERPKNGSGEGEASGSGESQHGQAAPEDDDVPF